MKNVRLTYCGLALAALAATAAVTATTAGAAGAPCTPTPVTVKGNAGLAFCGPATATLTIGGKTYSFQKGLGAELPHSNSFQLSLGVDIGTLTGPDNNGDKPGLSLDIAKNEKSAALAFAYVGGHELVKGEAVTVAGKGLAAATFKGKTSAFSGSWNCHGVIDKSSRRAPWRTEPTPGVRLLATRGDSRGRGRSGHALLDVLACVRARVAPVSAWAQL